MATPASTFSIIYSDADLTKRLQRLRSLTKELGDKSLVVGTNRQYMKQHQLGLKGNPKREFLGVSEEDKAEIIFILDKAIAEPKENGATLALTEIGEYMLLSTDLRWEQEVAPDGTPWAKNTAFTINQKKTLGRIQKVLQSTGLARSTISYDII